MSRGVATVSYEDCMSGSVVTLSYEDCVSRSVATVSYEDCVSRSVATLVHVKLRKPLEGVDPVHSCTDLHHPQPFPLSSFFLLQFLK